MAGALKQRFNDDLLLEEEDQKRAKERFSSPLFAVLYFEELCTFFKKYEKRAKEAKQRRGYVGAFAILAGMLALGGAAAAPVYHLLGAPWPAILVVFSVFLGITSVVIGLFGVGSTKHKQFWLLNRLMTERLRQFHLQTLVRRIPSVLEAMESNEGRTRYIHARKEWLASFKARYKNHLQSRLRGVLDDIAEDDVWLHDAELSHVRFDEADAWSAPVSIGAHLTELFRAYAELRFDHQIQYADFKLDRSGVFFASAVRQNDLLRGLTLGCILIVLA